MTSATRQSPPIRFRGRSFMAIVLAPEAPLDEWLAGLDALARRSPAFFVGRPVILDITALPLGREELTGLIADLHGRDVRLMGIEGADPAFLGLGLPPPLAGGRPVGDIELPGEGAREAVHAAQPVPAGSLVVDSPVRSGQSVVYPEGDVTVVGSVSSGAEIIAGGSIHIYGTLRGRAVAGSTGNAQARIYCRKLEAELLAIDGLYTTADDMEAELRGRPVKAWLDGDAVRIAALD